MILINLGSKDTLVQIDLFREHLETGKDQDLAIPNQILIGLWIEIIKEIHTKTKREVLVYLGVVSILTRIDPISTLTMLIELKTHSEAGHGIGGTPDQITKKDYP